MAISRLTGQDAKGATASGSTVAATYPGATTSGNALIATVWEGTGAATPTITGWTQQANIGLNGTTASVTLFTRIADGTETTVTANLGATVIGKIHIYEYTGNSNPLSFDVAATTAGNGTTGVTTFDTPTITTTDSSDLIFGVMALNGSATSPAWSVGLNMLQQDAATIRLWEGDLIPGVTETSFKGTSTWTGTLKPSSIIMAISAAAGTTTSTSTSISTSTTTSSTSTSVSTSSTSTSISTSSTSTSASTSSTSSSTSISTSSTSTSLSTSSTSLSLSTSSTSTSHSTSSTSSSTSLSTSSTSSSTSTSVSTSSTSTSTSVSTSSTSSSFSTSLSTSISSTSTSTSTTTVITDIVKPVGKINPQPLTNTVTIDTVTLVDDPVRLVDDTTALTGSQIDQSPDMRVRTISGSPRGSINSSR